jgi:uncharacterized protein YuzE
MIRTSYDPEADSMYVRFGPDCVKSAEPEEVASGIMLDFDEGGEVIGIEILYISRRAAKPEATSN